VAPQQYVADAPGGAELASPHVLHPLDGQIDRVAWIASHLLIEARISAADKPED
jgi:hypothetical protein